MPPTSHHSCIPCSLYEMLSPRRGDTYPLCGAGSVTFALKERRNVEERQGRMQTIFVEEDIVFLRYTSTWSS